MSKALSETILIRKAIDSDVPFIFNSWLRSFRDSWFAKGMPKTIYFTEHHKVIEKLLATCDVLMAVDPNDSARLFGYICCENVQGIYVVHYVYVKETYRMLGVANTLMKHCNEKLGEVLSIYTHKNASGEKLAAKYNFVYSPYVALNDDYRKKEKINEFNHKKEESK